MNKIANAMENGEYDFDGTHDKQILPPVVVRANFVKSQIADIETLKQKLENKEEDTRELKKLIKLKVSNLFRILDNYLQSSLTYPDTSVPRLTVWITEFPD